MKDLGRSGLGVVRETYLTRVMNLVRRGYTDVPSKSRGVEEI